MKERSGDFAMVDSSIMAAAHELKSPISLVRQLALELEVTASSQQNELLRQIILTSERSLRLTTNLTRYRQLNASLGQLDMEPINAQQLCEEVAHELWPLFRAYDRRIEVERKRRAPLVIANRDLLRRILLQFGDNALHYTNSSAVTLSSHKTGSGIRVGVRDGGPTSPVPKNPNIGRPASSSLGLMLAKQFASMMNGNVGDIRHRSGMTFYVEMLPSEQLSLL